MSLLSFPARAHSDQKRVLAVYDGSKKVAATTQWVVPMLVNLLGHFDCTVTTMPAEAYQPGLVEAHDAAILLGLDPQAILPPVLVADIYDTDRAVCWLGGCLGELTDRFSLGRYGFRVEENSAPDGSASADEPSQVLYRSQVLKRSPAAGPLPRITVTHRASCQVLAVAERPGGSQPYAVRSGKFWYFAEVPLLDLSAVQHPSAGVHLVLADQLHQILGERHPPRQTAVIRIDGVSARTDPGHLRDLVRHLGRERLPFAIAVIPVFKDPTQDLEVALSRRRSVVGAVRAAQREGAVVVVEGLTHQFHSRSGEDAEFWDMSRNRPPLGRTPVDTADRIETAIAELARCGLYPTIWATPAGRASSADYQEIAKRCSTAWERRLSSVLAPAPQTFPFLVAEDSYGQRVIPDNLPVVGGEDTDVETILELARCQTVVPDPYLSIMIAPEASLDTVRLVLSGIREMGFEFADLRRTRSWVKGRSLEVHSVDKATPIVQLIPKGWDASVLERGRRERTRYEAPGRDPPEKASLAPGALLITYLPGKRPREIFAFEGGPQELAQRTVSNLARVIVILGVVVCLLFILIYLIQVLLERRA